MGNLSHTVGGTDNLVSFKSAARVPIDSLKVYFSPIQEGEGDPSPENVRPIRGLNEVEAYKSGKNIAQVTGYNAMNSANADIHNKLSNDYGTTISTNNFGWPDTSVTITQTTAPNNNSITSYQNGYFTVMVKNLIYGCDYDVSFKVTDIKNNLLNCSLDNINIASQGRLQYKCSEIKDNVLIFKNVKWIRYSEDPMNSHYNRSGFEIRNCGMSFTLSEFMVTPVGMNDGVFEPYCGEVIPVTFPVIGKNKFNGEISNTNIGNIGETLDIIYNRTSSSLIPVIHGQYTLSCSENYPVAIYAYDDNGFIANESLVTWQESPTTFVIEKSKYVRFKWKKSDDSAFSPSDITNIQLELGSEATAYETYNPDNTIYGGYVDLAKGEVVAEWAKVTKKLSDYTSKTEYDGLIFYNYQPVSDLKCLASPDNGHAGTISPQNSKCSIAPHRWAMADFKKNHYYIYRNDTYTRLLLYLTPSSIDSEDIEFELAFKLQEPIHYYFNDISLTTFLGQNNFWSDTNDVTEVSYAIHDTASIRAAKKRIIMASPCLETASNGLVNFNTDVVAPLKECKVYFEPVQEGEGDPSPENIRPISGWESIETTKCGKNLCNENTLVNGYIRGAVTTTGTEIGFLVSGSSWRSTDFIKVTPNTIYTINYAWGNAAAAGIAFYKKATMDSAISGISMEKMKQSPYTIITPAECNYVRFTSAYKSDMKMSIELGSTITEYESYQGQILTITFPSEAGTIYGGYVDLVNGEIIKNWNFYMITGEETFYESGDWVSIFVPSGMQASDDGSLKMMGFCSHYPYRAYSRGKIGVMYNERTVTLDGSVRDATGWKTYCQEQYNNGTPITLCYPLKTPIHYPIDPQTLKTLRGTNNIWSTSNGPITIKYWKH